MNADKFQLSKARRLINTEGVEFTFYRDALNDYGEPNGNQTVSGIVKGVYHEKTEFITKMKSDSSTVRTKVQPMILCIWNSIQSFLVHTDKVTINGKIYTISEIKNICESNIVADLCLEEVQNT